MPGLLVSRYCQVSPCTIHHTLLGSLQLSSVVYVTGQLVPELDLGLWLWLWRGPCPPHGCSLPSCRVLFTGLGLLLSAALRLRFPLPPSDLFTTCLKLKVDFISSLTRASVFFLAVPWSCHSWLLVHELRLHAWCQPFLHSCPPRPGELQVQIAHHLHVIYKLDKCTTFSGFDQ